MINASRAHLILKLIASAGLVSFFVVIMMFGFRLKNKTAEITEDIESKIDASLGAQLYDISGNPAQDLPETNPFVAQTNPFSDIKTNPFR